jgi:sulfate adenylyltransferase subunit 1 (EFTu-like GTPase family)
MSVTLTLEDELDLSRGDLLAAADHVPETSSRIEAHLVWMNERPLDLARRYLLKHTSRMAAANVTAMKHRVDVNTMWHETANTLELNGIGVVEIETAKPLHFDAYWRNRTTGSFILIDAESNATVAAGMIERALGGARSSGPVTAKERRLRYGHGPEVIAVAESIAHELERLLFEHGCAVTVVREPSEEVLAALRDAGLMALVMDDRAGADDIEEIWARLFGSEGVTGGEGI